MRMSFSFFVSRIASSPRAQFLLAHFTAVIQSSCGPDARTVWSCVSALRRAVDGDRQADVHALWSSGA